VPGTDSHDTGVSGEPPGLDSTTPQPSRMYDYWLGGKDNFAADRVAARWSASASAAGMRRARQAVLANRAFLARVVRYLAAEAGIRQFLDIGTGLPADDNTHEVAQREAPQSRVVYVDNDPVVLTHARALLVCAPEGATAYVDADLREPEVIVERAEATLDFSQPGADRLPASPLMPARPRPPPSADHSPVSPGARPLSGLPPGADRLSASPGAGPSRASPRCRPSLGPLLGTGPSPAWPPWRRPALARLGDSP
jgi:S-adenosyl methyltransferase